MTRPNRPLDILLVEDNPADVRLTQEALKENHAIGHLTVVGDGVEAMTRLRDPSNRRPDLILLDLNLPRMDGRQVLQALKTDSDLHTIPIVVLTSSTRAEDVQRAYDLHANSFVPKPIGFGEFLRTLKIIETFWLGVVSLPGPALAGKLEV